MHKDAVLEQFLQGERQKLLTVNATLEEITESL